MTVRAFGQRVRERAAFRFEQAGAHLLAGRQHGDDGVHLLAELGEGRGGLRADIPRGLLRALRIEVIKDDLIAALHQIGGHRPAHVSDADESDGFDVSHHHSPCS